MATSSANPFKLGRYASDGLALVATLETHAGAVAGKLASLRGSGSPYVPALGDPDATFTDLVGDWHHLDEFAGDVANAFFQANERLGERPLTREQMNALVLTMGDASILRHGHVGYADRDAAIAAANQLTQDIQAAMEDGASAEELDALASRAARGQFDPAFAVTFVEGMGVDGMVRIPALIEAAWPGGEYGHNPGWGQERLLPFAAILTTAMDTRAATPQIDRQDPNNEDLADDDRLGEDWVREFTEFWQGDQFDQPNNFHYSLLVENAALPSDVLVEVANHQLDYMLAHNASPISYMNGFPWGPEDSMAEINILDALGANRDASLEWLGTKNPGDGTIYYPGRTVTNLELLLGFEPNTTNPVLGDALATVVDNGLQHWDDTESDRLFEIAVDTVGGDQDSVHFQQLLPTLGEGARTHMDQLADRTHEVMPSSVGDVDANAQQGLYNAHDFLKVLMDNDDAANSVYRGSLEFVQDTLSSDTGDGFGGESRQIGGLMGLVTEADENARVEATEARIAARQSFLDGVGLVKDVVGLVPVAGQTASSAISIGSFALDQAIDNFGMSGLEGAVDQEYANMANVRDGIRAELTSATAAYEYGVRGTWTSAEVIDATNAALGSQANGLDTDFFADGTTGESRPIKPYAEMTADEQRAYNAWLNSDPVGDAIAGDRTAAGQRMDEVIDSLEHR